MLFNFVDESFLISKSFLISVILKFFFTFLKMFVLEVGLMLDEGLFMIVC